MDSKTKTKKKKESPALGSMRKHTLKDRLARSPSRIRLNIYKLTVRTAMRKRNRPEARKVIKIS
jgi:hypothetical protein